MYVPGTIIGLQYAQTAIPVNANKEAREQVFNAKSSDNDFVLAFMKDTVDYAKVKYAGTYVLTELETFLMSLYAPFYNEINNTVLRIDGEPVTLDSSTQELVFIS